MYWPSSGKTAGYEKGKYSLALPAGVAFLALFISGIGFIISCGFPTIAVEWTVNHVCIRGEWHNEYTNWMNGTNRRVVVAIDIWKMKNLKDFLFTQGSPTFSKVGSYVFEESASKQNVKFSDNQVEFKIASEYSKIIQESSMCDEASCTKGAKMPFLNLDLLRSEHTLSESINVFRGVCSKLDDYFVDTVKVSTDVSKRALLSRFLNENCTKNDGEFCHLLRSFAFSFNSDKRMALINQWMIDIIIDECRHINDTPSIDSYISCDDICGGTEVKHIFLITYHICRTTVKEILNTCSSENNSTVKLFGDNPIEQKKYLDILDQMVFSALKTFVTFSADKESILKYATPFELSVGSGSQKGILNDVLGFGKTLKLDLCVARWELDASTIFQNSNNDLYDFPLDIHVYSEHALPPSKRLSPCLSPTPTKSYLVLFDGIWQPLHFSFQTTSRSNGVLLHNYEAADVRLLDDDGYIDVSDGYNYPLVVTNPCGNGQMQRTFSLCSNDSSDSNSNFKFSVEPMTGAFWEFNLEYQLNVKLPDSIYVLYNISSEYRNQLLPFITVRRHASVTPDGETYYQLTLKPFLMTMCGGSVVFLTAALLVFGLAIHLTLRLYWKPGKGRMFVAEMPELDHQQLNTVKLRKLLGH